MCKRNHIVLFALLFSLLRGFAQTKDIDSLKKLLGPATDTTRVNLLNQISKAFWYVDPSMTIQYSGEAINLAEKLNFTKGMTSAYNNTGVGFYQQNKYEEALKWYGKALEVHRKTGNFVGEGYVLSNMGLIYWKQGALPVAVEYYLKSLKIWEDHKLENEMSSIFDNLGNVYNEQEQFDTALVYYFKAVEIQKKYPDDEHQESMTLSNIGTAYLAKHDNQQALNYFLKSLALLDDDEKESRAVSLSNIGLTYIELRDYTKAEDFLVKALKLQEEIEDTDGMIHTVLGLSKTSQKKKSLQESERYARQALALALKINDLPVLVVAWQMLSNLAIDQGDFKNGYQYYVNFVKARDSLAGKENLYKVAKLEAGFETQKKQTEIETLKQQHQQQAFRRNALGVGLIALLIIAALIVSRQRLKIRKNSQFEKINRQLIAQSEQLEEQAERLREIDKLKSTFFANISHEFRTPLTLVLNSISDRISHAKLAGDHAGIEQLDVIHRNARRLLHLINQLLDLSKLEARQMKLSPADCDLSALVKVVHASFSSYAVSRQINFGLELFDHPVFCRLDSDKVEKVLFNLLSNAFKFTPVGGTIVLRGAADHANILLSVVDNGPGIAKEEMAHVFNRFYQGKQYYSDEQGTGIGLALTKELVELHGGKIWVESDGSGTCFHVQLPLVPASREEISFPGLSEKFLGDQLPSILSTEELEVQGQQITSSQEEDRPNILLIEDNEDLRKYISHQLADQYVVIEKENGRAGLEEALTMIPDLIITDWMMPEMDGLRLCQTLKTDERTSHIPIIMLTALSSDDSKLQGLATGADDYLTKPFDNRELSIRVKNLIESRRSLRERYSRELHLGPQKLQVSSVDERFLERVMQTIEAYMGDPDFSMIKFGQEVGLSRMQLHRKLKALTGESPGDFLRTMRLRRARQLLEAGAGNVSEIAYEVGFNNLSYFSKCFREQFNLLPNDVISANVTKVSTTVTK